MKDISSPGDSKFLLFLDLQTGFFIIGILEVVATVFQIINVSYSIRIGIACLFLFNVPLLLTWTMSQYYQRKGEFFFSYKFNTLFITVYQARLILLIIGGFVFLLYTNQNDGIVNFVCDRYYGIDQDDSAALELNTTL